MGPVGPFAQDCGPVGPFSTDLPPFMPVYGLFRLKTALFPPVD